MEKEREETNTLAILQDFSVEDPTGDSYEQRIIRDSDFGEIASFVDSKIQWNKFSDEVPIKEDKICLFIQFSQGMVIHEYIGKLEDAKYFRKYEMENYFTHWRYLSLPSPPENK